MQSIRKEIPEALAEGRDHDDAEVAAMLRELGIALVECEQPTQLVAARLLAIAKKYTSETVRVVVLPTALVVQIGTVAYEVETIVKPKTQLNLAGRIDAIAELAEVGAITPADAAREAAAARTMPPRFGPVTTDAARLRRRAGDAYRRPGRTTTAVAADGRMVAVRRCHRDRCRPVRLSLGTKGSLLWLILAIGVALVGQKVGGLFLSPTHSGAIGACLVVPFAMLGAQIKTFPPAIVMMLAAFWALVPGALSFEEVGRSAADAGDISTRGVAVAAFFSIALGTLIGWSVFATINTRPGR